MKKTSNIRDKFKKQREGLVKRHQEQIDSKDDKTYPTIFDKEKIPEGVEFWKCGKGDHLIDIIPFFAGQDHPKVNEGELAYVVDFHVHQGVGVMKEPFVCQTKTFRKNDPICEYISANRLPLEDWNKIKPKRRTVYLVWVHDTPEEEAKGIQIWEVAHYFFENYVDEIAKSPRGGGAVAFSDIDSGKSIAFSVKVTGKYKDANGTDRDSVSYLGHRFVDREEPIPDQILDQIFPLDGVIQMHPDNDYVEKAFYGEGPKKTASTESRLDRLKKREQQMKESEDDNPSETEDDDALDEALDSHEDDIDDIIDPDEDEPDEEPEGEEETCPLDKFGVGLDKYKECKVCNIWDDCSDENEKLQKESKPKLKKRGK